MAHFGDTILEYLYHKEKLHGNSVKPYNVLGGKLDGRREKEFVRIASRIFKDLIDEIKLNPKTRFVTMYNDLIKEGYTPRWISALKKSVMVSRDILIKYPEYRDVEIDAELAIKEQCAMNLCANMDIDTAYNKLLNYKGEETILSVDFISPGEEFFTLQDFNLNVDKTEDLESLYEKLCDNFDNIMSQRIGLPDITEESKNEQLTKLTDEIIYAVFLRKWILADADCDSLNLGFLVDREAGTIRLAPQYDLEFALSEDSLIDYKFAGFNGLSWLNKNFPHIYKRLKNNVENLTTISEDSGLLKYEKIIADSVGNNKEIYDHIVRIIKDRIYFFNGMSKMIDYGFVEESFE